MKNQTVKESARHSEIYVKLHHFREQHRPQFENSMKLIKTMIINDIKNGESNPIIPLNFFEEVEPRYEAPRWISKKYLEEMVELCKGYK
jgi:hypothetical protein